MTANYNPKGNRILGDFDIPNPMTGRIRKMKVEVKETIKIDDGKHKGMITAIEYKDKPYNYVDVVIREKELNIDLKLGLPFSVTENTVLGKLLITFGAKLEVGQEVEIEDFLKKDLLVEFLTITETTKKGTFARIVADSLKPVA